MQRGAHLAFGILLLWFACVCYYVAFTMGHTSSKPGYLALAEQQVATNIQSLTGASTGATSTASNASFQTGGAGAAGGTSTGAASNEGGGV